MVAFDVAEEYQGDEEMYKLALVEASWSWGQQ